MLGTRTVSITARFFSRPSRELLSAIGRAAPKLILPSLQVNMRAGQLPEPESNGTRYLKLPLNTL